MRSVLYFLLVALVALAASIGVYNAGNHVEGVVLALCALAGTAAVAYAEQWLAQLDLRFSSWVYEMYQDEIDHYHREMVTMDLETRAEALATLNGLKAMRDKWAARLDNLGQRLYGPARF